jgi:hypothetical protein
MRRAAFLVLHCFEEFRRLRRAVSSCLDIFATERRTRRADFSNVGIAYESNRRPPQPPGAPRPLTLIRNCGHRGCDWALRQNMICWSETPKHIGLAALQLQLSPPHAIPCSLPLLHAASPRSCLRCIATRKQCKCNCHHSAFGARCGYASLRRICCTRWSAFWRIFPAALNCSNRHTV